MKYLLFYFTISPLLVASMYITPPGPKYPPTKGEVWPSAAHETKEQKYLIYNPSHLKINNDLHGNWFRIQTLINNSELNQLEVTKLSCTILERAIRRYTYIINKLQDTANRHRTHGQTTERTVCAPNCAENEDENFLGTLQEFHIELTKPCEDYPYLNMDEKYTLDTDSVSKLQSDSIWGILRGLETFSQLMYISRDYSEIRMNKTSIQDYPRYPHRGLLLDTSRHYMSMTTILIILDGMAMNKMNVFHWHIVDDQSFPYQSEKFPELSQKGAYDPTMVYTKDDIQTVINFARDRGIRVIPEFDVPGHTASWGAAYPNLLTECFEHDTPIGLGPMNPINNDTYKLIEDLFKEVQDLFPDKYLHVGGDEVELECWSSNPAILAYMYSHRLDSVTRLHELFMRNTIPLLGTRSTPIVWQEVFDNGVPLSNDSVVQVWKSGGAKMEHILSSGKRVLFSSSWYLDHINKDWVDYYKEDPRSMVENVKHLENIIGGEACMWGEKVDDRNVISRIWPRASAVAERLWSEPFSSRRAFDYGLEVPRHVYNRLEEHTCRMITRGVGAQPPTGPGYCIV